MSQVHADTFQAIQQNHTDIAKIYAQNAIRKQNEKLNLLRLASRIDAVSSRVQTAVTMRQVTGSMANVVRGMDGAMKSMDLEKVGPFLYLLSADGFRESPITGMIRWLRCYSVTAIYETLKKRC